MRYQLTVGSAIARTIIVIILLLIAAACLYPAIYVVSMSLSDYMIVIRREVVLLPRQISFDAYRLIFEQSQVWRSYYNTLWYTIVGTSINLTLTLLTAYPLSRRNLVFKKQIIFIFAFTMWFSGGMIPTFLVVRNLGLFGSRWAMVLPGAITVWNLIITRTFFMNTIPEELVESGKIDGASDLRILIQLVLPISKAIIAVNTLFYAVGHWNAFFPAILYLPDSSMHPIQVLLRNMLLTNTRMTLEGTGDQDISRRLIAEKLQYVVVAIAVLPITIVYPFLQKYFVQGAMLGSLKG